jgi:hypothetical protein
MSYEVAFIEHAIANAMEDLDILYKHDKITIDHECFNELNSILSSAEDGVKTAIVGNEKRRKQRLSSPPNTFGVPYGK